MTIAPKMKPLSEKWINRLKNLSEDNWYKLYDDEVIASYDYELEYVFEVVGSSGGEKGEYLLKYFCEENNDNCFAVSKNFVKYIPKSYEIALLEYIGKENSELYEKCRDHINYMRCRFCKDIINTDINSYYGTSDFRTCKQCWEKEFSEFERETSYRLCGECSLHYVDMMVCDKLKIETYSDLVKKLKNNCK